MTRPSTRTPLPAALAALVQWVDAQPALDGVQLWSADDTGFHPRLVVGRPADDHDRFHARSCCLSGALRFDNRTLAVPLSLPSGTTAAALFVLAGEADQRTREHCASQLAALGSVLDDWLDHERVARLSGSTLDSHGLRQALVAAHAVEHGGDLWDQIALLHAELRGLLYAENFFVIVVDEDRQWLRYIYYHDPNDHDWAPLTFREGELRGLLSAQVIASGRITRGMSDELLVQAGHSDTLELDHFGPASVDWLGVPMTVGDEVIGAVVVQSYDPAISFGESDPLLLSMIAEALGASLQRRRVRERLERTVAERTIELARARDAAEDALRELKATQAQLLMAEKMASLGQLVAGVAHEVNTPLGIALTAATHLQARAAALHEAVRTGSLTRSALNAFAAVADESSTMIERNLVRAAELIETFKRVSVDRSADDRRRFALDSYLRDLLTSMTSTWRQRPVTVDIETQGDLGMDSYPGTLGEIVTNLVQNALLHAFSPEESGRILLRACPLRESWLLIEVIDDGAGMTPDVQARIFEPFFTTRRNRGGTGLGLHIVFNHVSQRLGGRVLVDSQPGSGTTFRVEVPAVAPG